MFLSIASLKALVLLAFLIVFGLNISHYFKKLSDDNNSNLFIPEDFDPIYHKASKGLESQTSYYLKTYNQEFSSMLKGVYYIKNDLYYLQRKRSIYFSLELLSLYLKLCFIFT